MNRNLKVTKEIFYSPVKLIALFIVSIIFFEILIMLILDRITFLSFLEAAIVDGIILLFFLIPISYFLFFRPMLQYSIAKKQSEEAHRNAREFSENLIRTANVIVVGLDTFGKVNILNEAAEKATGYTFDELKGKNWFETLVPKNKFPDVWKEFVSLVEKSAVPKTFENKILTKSGEVRFISWQNSVICEGEKVKGTISFGVDLTDRKRVELEEQLLHEITQGVTTALNLDELLKLIHHSLSKVLYAENCFFALYDEKTRLFSFPFFVDKYDEVTAPVDMSKSCTAYAYRSGKSLIITPEIFDQLKEENEVELIGSPSPSWIGVPLKTSTKIIGVLVLQHYEKENVYDESNLGFLDSIASQVANVIERKRAEEELAKSFSLLSATLEASADGILVVDKNGITTNYNKRFAELWRIPESMMIEADDNKLLSYVTDQLKDPDGFKKKVRELYSQNESESFDVLEFKDGRIFQRYSKPQMFESQSVGRVWSFHDITELKHAEKELMESEKKFRTFFEKSPIGIEIYNSDGFQIDVNEAAMDIFGIADKSCCLGFNIFEGTSLNENLKAKLFSGEPIEYNSSFDFDKIKEIDQFKSQKSGKAELHYSITPMKSENKDSVLGYLLLVQDITERMRIEKALKENESRLIELNAAKDKFFSIISHDLRSPFNSIIGFSDLLVRQIKEKDYEGIEEYAQIMQNSSVRAMDLLTNLLEWSRSQTGRIDFNPEYIEIESVIDEVIALLLDAAVQKSISIIKLLPRKLPFLADKAMFATIVRNLVSNAIKYTYPGGEIKIKAEIKETELMVSVSDNGIGIKKENINRLFMVDQKTSTPGTRNENGTGLGLVLCKEFVAYHEGKIWVESELGKGSTFYFTMKQKVLEGIGCGQEEYFVGVTQ